MIYLRGFKPYEGNHGVDMIDIICMDTVSMRKGRLWRVDYENSDLLIRRGMMDRGMICRELLGRGVDDIPGVR